jgi:hypothetical protein
MLLGWTSDNSSPYSDVGQDRLQMVGREVYMLSRSRSVFEHHICALTFQLQLWSAAGWNPRKDSLTVKDDALRRLTVAMTACVQQHPKCFPLDTTTLIGQDLSPTPSNFHQYNESANGFYTRRISWRQSRYCFCVRWPDLCLRSGLLSRNLASGICAQVDIAAVARAIRARHRLRDGGAQ